VALVHCYGVTEIVSIFLQLDFACAKEDASWNWKDCFDVGILIKLW
jgi:hypothetical protein